MYHQFISCNRTSTNLLTICCESLHIPHVLIRGNSCQCQIDPFQIRCAGKDMGSLSGKFKLEIIPCHSINLYYQSFLYTSYMLESLFLLRLLTLRTLCSAESKLLAGRIVLKIQITPNRRM